MKCYFMIFQIFNTKNYSKIVKIMGMIKVHQKSVSSTWKKGLMVIDGANHDNCISVMVKKNSEKS